MSGIGNPLTDPLWSDNTYGWTNQANTGDVPAVGNSLGVVSPYDAELTGVYASTMDAAGVVVDAFTPAISSATFYGGLVYLGGPAKTTKFFCAITTAGTATHGYVALLSTAGATLAVSADLTTLATGTGSWAAAATLASGYYYLGVATLSSVASKMAGTANAGVLCGNAPGLVYASTGPFPKFVTSSTTITITSSFPTSVTLAAQASGTVGAPYVAMF